MCLEERPLLLLHPPLLLHGMRVWWLLFSRLFWLFLKGDVSPSNVSSKSFDHGESVGAIHFVWK
jgi:hypothetical protein